MAKNLNWHPQQKQAAQSVNQKHSVIEEEDPDFIPEEGGIDRQAEEVASLKFPVIKKKASIA